MGRCLSRPQKEGGQQSSSGNSRQHHSSPLSPRTNDSRGGGARGGGRKTSSSDGRGGYDMEPVGAGQKYSQQKQQQLMMMRAAAAAHAYGGGTPPTAGAGGGGRGGGGGYGGGGGGGHSSYVVTPSPSTFAAEMHQQGQGQGGYPYNAYHQQQGKGGGGRMGHRRSSSDIDRVLAIYDYNNMVNGDVCFYKGDIMELLDDSNYDWWYVRHPKNGVGYAPRNFLARIESMESEEWYAGKVQRSQAEKLVCAGGLPRGTFLVRKRENGGGGCEYALTINDSSEELFEVKHYKIRPLDNGTGFYITTRKVFATIRDLIAYYSKEPGGLCCRLTVTAPKLAPVRPDLSYDTARNWEIPREELQMVEKLGDGNFGTVWLARWRKTVEVAVKMMKPGSMSVNAFLREAQIMKSLNHAKLVKLYAVCTMCEPYYIVTEYMVNGSLLHYLRASNGRLQPHALVDMCSQVANGMMYLENRKLVHRDLAARNVLVGEVISGVPEVKVADFGLARNLMEENIYAAHAGAKFPIKWTAPEAAQYGNFTIKSDVWSFGVLVYEIFTSGHTPYPGMQNREVVEQLSLGYRMPRPQTCPGPVYAEVLKCWDDEPSRRPTFEYLFGFFDDYFINSQCNYQPPSVDGIALEAAGR